MDILSQMQMNVKCLLCIVGYTKKEYLEGGIKWPDASGQSCWRRNSIKAWEASDTWLF